LKSDGGHEDFAHPTQKIALDEVSAKVTSEKLFDGVLKENTTWMYALLGFFLLITLSNIEDISLKHECNFFNFAETHLSVPSALS
jgi:hypothetical protein